MDLISKINDRLKEFLIQRNSIGSGVLKGIKSEIHNKEIEFNAEDKTLSEDDILSIIKKEAKKRTDAYKLYSAGKRDDLAEKEKMELKIIEEFLPEQISDDELKKIVDDVISSMGDNTNFGVVMSNVMAKVSGRADGSAVSRIVKEKLK